jgi:hypothetical protein
MKNNITNIIVGCIAIVAAVFAVAVVVGGHRTGDGSGGAGSGLTGTSGLAGTGGSATPDDVSVAPVPSDDGGASDDEVVTDQTDGYSFTMPTDWYLEPNAGAGVTVYPDYDPTSGDEAACKIEISELATGGTDAAGGSGAVTDESSLNAWITSYLHADPTADISEYSRTDITIGAGDSTTTAIEWQGALNGVSTTLVYAVAPASDGNGSSGANILEFAPSTLVAEDGDDCTIELQALLANFTLSS